MVRLAVSCVMVLWVSIAAWAQDSKTNAPADRFVLVRVRVLPQPGTGRALAGARVAGSLEGPTAAFVQLARIAQAPTNDTWLDLRIRPGKVYRYLKLESAEGKTLALAELEFHSPAGKLAGKPFGTSVPEARNAVEKAFDGDPATVFETTVDQSYAGVDLGEASQSPRPRFKPEGGAFAEPQRVELSVWPPGAAIRYATDGSAPTATTGEVYRGPIHVARETTIAAASFQRGLADSDVEIASYQIGASAVERPAVRTYHVGNSLTDTVNGFLSVAAASAGKNLYYMRKTIPGCGLMGNWKTCGQGFASPEDWANDYKVVSEKRVDHLFLQPFPNPPGLDDDAEAGFNFMSLARQHNPDAQVWLFAQWPSLTSWTNDAHCRGADWMKPAWFPPNRNPRSWEDALENKMLYYRELMKRWGSVPGGKPVRLCPGGPALLRLRNEIEGLKIPGIANFRAQIFSDDIHLARPGRYLIALVHYACIFGESPEYKVTFANSGLTLAQARVFQRVAWETVINEPMSGFAVAKPKQ